MRLELCAPRTVSVPAGTPAPTFRPWLEVSALARVAVPTWEVKETAWAHWAMAIHGARADVDAARPFDPSRRAAAPGEPPEAARVDDGRLEEGEAVRVCEILERRWRPELHYHPVLRLASTLGEPLEAFRRRCRAALAPALLSAMGARRSREATPLVAEVESRLLGAGELEVLRWRAGVAWYASIIQPEAAPEDPMMLGPQGRGR